VKPPGRRISHLLQAWPQHLPTSEPPSMVVHVRGGDRLQREVSDLKAKGFRVRVVPVGASNDGAWWA
jgi:hypothetical protein